jgi:tetratricopeptide (TPR) repeat protein
MQTMASGLLCSAAHGLCDIAVTGMSTLAARPHLALTLHNQSTHHEIFSVVPKGAIRILTVGCGAGDFGRELKKTDHRRNVMGIVFPEDAHRIPENAFDDFYSVDVEKFDPPFKAGDFDCLILVEILERLVDPWNFVKRYTGFLKPNGTVIASLASVRNIEVLKQLVEFGRWTYQDEGIINPRYLRFFTKKELLRLMEQLNIKVESIHYLGSSPLIDAPSIWSDHVVTCGNFSLRHVNAYSLAELYATRLLFIGTNCAPNGSAHETAAATEQVYANALHLATIGQIEQAISAFLCLLDQDPACAPAHNELGVLHYQLKEKGKALFHYEKATEIDPHNTTYAKNLADFFYEEMGRIEDAQELYCRILNAQPQDVEALEVMANICVSLEQAHIAEKLYSKLLRLVPGHSNSQAWLQAIHDSKNRVNEPSTAEHGYQQAKILIAAGQVEEAVSILEILTDTYPNRGIFHNDLGVLYTQMDNLPKARAHYEQAVNLSPTNGTFLKNLGDFYLSKLGMVEDFIRLYLASLQVEPRDVEALLMLGKLYAELQLYTEAESFYRKAQQIEPDNVHARNGLERLENAK